MISFFYEIRDILSRFNSFKASNSKRWKRQLESSKKKNTKIVNLPKYKELYYKFLIRFLNFWDGSSYSISGTGMVLVSYIALIFFMYLGLLIAIFNLLNFDLSSGIFSGVLLFCAFFHVLFHSIYRFSIKKSNFTLCGKIKNHYRKKLGFETFEQEPSMPERFYKGIKY